MKQGHESIAAEAHSAAILGSFQRTAEGALVMGRYGAAHRRIEPDHALRADVVQRRLSVIQNLRKHKSEKRELLAEFIELPRYLVDNYDAPNLVTDVGAKLLLDTIFAGSSFTAATYMGLKGSGAANVLDTQASHATGPWLEVGATNAPQYTSPRKTITWSAASGSGAGSRTKASSGTYTFAIITTGGTVDGAFLNINGTSAIDNTTGTLFSAGTFSGGSKVVAVSDTLTVTYSLAI